MDAQADEVFWLRRSDAKYTAGQKSALEIQAAFTQELLGQTDFGGNYKDDGLVRLFRTENLSAVKETTKTGQSAVFPRGLNESYSVADLVTVHGTELFVQLVPHTRVASPYWLEKPRTGASGFLGDGENEFTANAYRLPAFRVGNARRLASGRRQEILDDDKLDLEAFAKKYKLDLDQLRDLR